MTVCVCDLCVCVCVVERVQRLASCAMATERLFICFLLNSIRFIIAMSAANKDNSKKGPLILESIQWQNIVKRLRPEAEANTRQSKEREYEEYLKNGSRAMTKNWTNSVEKIREREYLKFIRANEQKRAEGKWNCTGTAENILFEFVDSIFSGTLLP